MRQPSLRFLWKRIVHSMRRLTARRVVETLPTLEVGPFPAPVPRKTVEAPSSRFAPAEDTLPPAPRSSIEPGAIMVTELPVFAAPRSPRRSARPAGSPVLSARAAAVISVVGAIPPEIAPVVEETTGGSPSPRQGSRSRAGRQTGPLKVTVGDDPAAGVNSAAVSRERIARESYALKSRELERAADERLAYEQQLVERRIREQLEARQRELDSSLDEILEDTIILPRSIEGS